MSAHSSLKFYMRHICQFSHNSIEKNIFDGHVIPFMSQSNFKEFFRRIAGHCHAWSMAKFWKTMGIWIHRSWNKGQLRSNQVKHLRVTLFRPFLMGNSLIGGLYRQLKLYCTVLEFNLSTSNFHLITASSSWITPHFAFLNSQKCLIEVIKECVICTSIHSPWTKVFFIDSMVHNVKI